MNFCKRIRICVKEFCVNFIQTPYFQALIKFAKSLNARQNYANSTKPLKHSKFHTTNLSKRPILASQSTTKFKKSLAVWGAVQDCYIKTRHTKCKKTKFITHRTGFKIPFTSLSLNP